MSEALEVVPLGGCGEFGLNSTLLSYGGHSLLLDAGILFPRGGLPGVSLVGPDPEPIRERAEEIRGLLFTHAHEDHLGGAALLAPHLRCPMLGTAFTLAHLRERLREAGVSAAGRLGELRDGEAVELGPFRVLPLPAAHSIPQGVSLLVEAGGWRIVHLGDARLDPEPLDGRGTDAGALRVLGDEGVDLLLLDSTNAEVEEPAASERSVGRALETLLTECRGRLVLSTFSSHVHRVQLAAEVAARWGRRLALTGSRLLRRLEIARHHGQLRLPSGVLLSEEEAGRRPAGEVLVVAPGCQGEPLSALARIARGEHPRIRLEEGDLVVLSSRRIPGSEIAVDRVVNHALRRGAEVREADSRNGLHVSGHPPRPELREILAALRPRSVLPVHGEYRQLLAAARLAERSLPAPANVLLAENGDRVTLDERGTRLAGRIEAGRVYLDGSAGEVDWSVVRDRRALARDGVLVPVLLLGPAGTGRPPRVELTARGFAPARTEPGLLEEAVAEIGRALAAGPAAAREDPGLMETMIADTLKRFVRRRTGRRPLILPAVHEV